MSLKKKNKTKKNTPYDITEDPTIETILLEAVYEVPRLEDLCLSFIKSNELIFDYSVLSKLLPLNMFEKIMHNF